MGEISEVSEQNEENALMLEENPSDDQSEIHTELRFPWRLIYTIIDSDEVFQSKSKLIKHMSRSFRFRLLMVFIISIVCVVFGSVYLHTCDSRRMLCIVFIVQGVCGLFVVLVHTCAIAFDWTPSRMVHLLIEYRRFIWCCVTSAYLVTIFSVIWFFIGQIWFFKQFISEPYNDSCSYVKKQEFRWFTSIIVVVQYIVGIWLIYCRISTSSRILRRLEKKIQHRPDQFPDNDTHLDTQEPRTCQEPVNSNDGLMLI